MNERFKFVIIMLRKLLAFYCYDASRDRWINVCCVVFKQSWKSINSSPKWNFVDFFRDSFGGFAAIRVEKKIIFLIGNSSNAFLLFFSFRLMSPRQWFRDDAQSLGFNCFNSQSEASTFINHVNYLKLTMKKRRKKVFITVGWRRGRNARGIKRNFRHAGAKVVLQTLDTLVNFMSRCSR